MMETQKIIKKSSFLNGEKLKKGLVTAKGSPVGFMSIDSETPQWINADRLFKLWSIGYNLGRFKPESLTGKAQVFFKLSKTNNIALQLDTNGFVVCVSHGTGVIEGGVLFLELKNGLRVIWHKELTCLAVDDFIFETHAIANKMGNALDGRLKFTEDTAVQEEALLNVEELFSLCSLAGPFHGCEDEEVLKYFDRPELLSVITTEIGKFAVLKERKNEEEIQIVSRLEELKQKGVDLQNIDELTLDDITKLREVMIT